MYKPKLEEILNDIIVLTELAELGAEADNLPDTEDSEQLDTKQLIEMNLKKRPQLSEARWSSVRFKHTANRSDSDMSSIVLDNRTDDDGGGGIGGVEDSPMPERSDTKDGDYNGKKGARWMRQSTTPSGLFRIKNLLDRWEEPVNKLDKVRVMEMGSSQATYSWVESSLALTIFLSLSTPRRPMNPASTTF